MQSNKIIIKGEAFEIFEGDNHKIVSSENYNYAFNKQTGFFARFGKNQQEDPEYALAPEILDLEIASEYCQGNCSFCYKCNSSDSKVENMSFEVFKNIFHKVKEPFLTQIAFGITDINGNPNFFKMMEYCRENGVIPNYTTHGIDLTEQNVADTKRLCGAVAVSIVDKNKSYNAIKSFTDAGMTQVNIHYTLSAESYSNAFKIIDEIATDSRLSKLNAIVFLRYKHKNNSSKFTSELSVEQYKRLVKYAIDKRVNIGMDSCSAPMYLKSIESEDNYNELSKYVESCESTKFSSYINVKGEFYPCSFTEGMGDWNIGLDVRNCNNFIDDIWVHEKLINLEINY